MNDTELTQLIENRQASMKSLSEKINNKSLYISDESQQARESIEELIDYLEKELETVRNMPNFSQSELARSLSKLQA